MTSGLETERAYSGFDATQIYHLLTYLDTYPLTYDPGTHTGQVCCEAAQPLLQCFKPAYDQRWPDGQLSQQPVPLTDKTSVPAVLVTKHCFCPHSG